MRLAGDWQVIETTCLSERFKLTSSTWRKSVHLRRRPPAPQVAHSRVRKTLQEAGNHVPDYDVVLWYNPLTLHYALWYHIDITSEAEDSPALCRDDAENPSEEEGNSKLSLISWNVDGLDSEQQPERARGLCSYLMTWERLLLSVNVFYSSFLLCSLRHTFSYVSPLIHCATNTEIQGIYSDICRASCSVEMCSFCDRGELKTADSVPLFLKSWGSVGSLLIFESSVSSFRSDTLLTWCFFRSSSNHTSASWRTVCWPATRSLKVHVRKWRRWQNRTASSTK